MPIDWSKPPTLVERLAVAARETVYMAALAWVLAEGSPLPLRNRLAIVEGLTDLDLHDAAAIVATTEWQGSASNSRRSLDLLLTTNGSMGAVHVAIENKIKSVDGPDQLAFYDGMLAQLGGKLTKLYLTLTGEAPRSGADWRPVQYATIIRLLQAQNSTNDYVTDLAQSIERLTSLAAAVRTDERLAQLAFRDAVQDTPSDIGSYVTTLRLEGVLQRTWMNELAQRIVVEPPWAIAIEETHGQALLNVQVALTSGVRIGMQLQSRTLKAFCEPFPVIKQASEQQRRDVEMILERIRHALKIGADEKPSKSKNRGFRSFSINALPPGRNTESWLSVLAPAVKRIVDAFRDESLTRLPLEADVASEIPTTR